MIEIAELWLYPIKACAGVRVTQAQLTRRGLAGDRRYMVVDAEGRFFTQREEPKLQAVRTALEGDSVLLDTAAGSLRVPSRLSGGKRTGVTVWQSDCEAIEYVPGSQLLSETLAREVKLVFMPDDVERSVDEDYGEPGDIVSFADGFPLLLANEASLADLNAALEQPVSMQRFRPSVVVRGAPAYQEETWSCLQIASIRLRAAKLCTRCAVINVDPGSGTRPSKEPLATLTVLHAPDGKPVFGVNLIPESLGSLREGLEFGVS